MRSIFIATGDIALPTFRHLLDHGPRPIALLTQPDKPVGRHQTLTAPAIKIHALAAGIPVMQPERIGDAVQQLAALNPELLIVMAYGQILPEAIIILPSIAIINLHASLLPKYRGAACIQAAIDCGDTETGITAMHVVRQLDAGDVILAKSLPITPHETGSTLHDRLAELAPAVLAETLLKLAEGTSTRIPQNPLFASHVAKLSRDDGRIDWSLSATTIERRIRAFDPWPGTFSIANESGRENRLKIYPPTRISAVMLEPGQISCEDGTLTVGCGTGALELTIVQPDGCKRMLAADYLRGRKPAEFR